MLRPAVPLFILTLCTLSASELLAQRIVHEAIDEKVLAASLFTGLIENNLALKSFDVTYVTEMTSLRPDGDLTIEQVKSRLVRTSEASNLVLARMSVFERVSEKEESHSRLSAVAFYCDASPLVRVIN